MQCPSCGAVISKEDLFCGECGIRLDKINRAVAPRPPLEERKEVATDTIDLTLPVRRPPAKKRVSPALVVLVFGSALLLLCLGGVGVLVWLGSEETESDSLPGPGSLAYAEDFGDPASGWDTYSEDDTRAGYVDGEYVLGVYRQEFMTWGNPLEEKDLTNFQVEVDARQVEGPLDNNFGLLVRYQPDGENYYWFEISGDGYYSVDLLQDDEWSTLVEWETSEAIRQGLGATNHLQVVCYRDRFAFYVNDTYLVGITDDSFDTGSIGLAVGTFDQAGVVVHFDNLRVYTLVD